MELGSPALCHTQSLAREKKKTELKRKKPTYNVQGQGGGVY